MKHKVFILLSAKIINMQVNRTTHILATVAAFPPTEDNIMIDGIKDHFIFLVTAELR
jgi:hypothetical protein